MEAKEEENVTCTAEQVVNYIPTGGMRNLPPKTSLGAGILSPIGTGNDIFSSFENDPENTPKTAKSPLNTVVFNGGRCRTRTCDPLRVRHI